jgi:hypothetical protein
MMFNGATGTALVLMAVQRWLGHLAHHAPILIRTFQGCDALTGAG